MSRRHRGFSRSCIFLFCLALAGSIGLACNKQPVKPPTLPQAVVTVCRPVERQVTEYIQYTGNTAALESVEVRARVRGFLQKVQFEPRARVKKDDVLFQIEPDQYQTKLAQAQAQVEGNKARLEMAMYEVSRLKALLEKDSAAVYEYNQSIAKRDEAKAALASSNAAVEEAQLNLKYTQVQAPITGRISRNLVDVGNLIEAGTTLLASITNDDSVYAYFDVSEADVLRIKALAAATQPVRPEHMPSVSAELGLMNEPGYPHHGQLDYISPSLDSTTGTIEIRARFSNPDGVLLPGLFARIRIPIGKPRNTLCVAETALGVDQGQQFLFVVNDRNIVEYRRVKVGLLDGALRVIQEGIEPTDWVIVNGLQRVRPGATVTTEPMSPQSSGTTTNVSDAIVKPVLASGLKTD